jgi:hypothetical protein
MKRGLKVAGAAVLVLAAGFGAMRIVRGPSGASSAYGGSIEANAPPELPSNDANAWVNGAPTTLAALHGSPVLLEVWSPT